MDKVGRRRFHGRLAFDRAWLDMPLVKGLGYHSIKTPIPLAFHSHIGYELTYLSSGEVTWETGDDQRMRLCGGQAAIMQPNVRHRGKWNIIEPADLFWIVFEPQAEDSTRMTPFSKEELIFMDGLLSSAGNSARKASPALALDFNLLLEAMAGWSDGDSDGMALPSARTAACRLLLSSAKLFSSTEPSACNSSKLQAGVVKFFEGKILGNPGMAETAERFGMSLPRFIETFKAETGLTPADFFRRMKCGKARELLSASGMSITEIAIRLGFSSSQNFAHVFKRYTGMTPSEFRRRKHSGPNFQDTPQGLILK